MIAASTDARVAEPLLSLLRTELEAGRAQCPLDLTATLHRSDLLDSAEVMGRDALVVSQAELLALEQGGREADCAAL